MLLPSASVFLLLLCNDREVLGPWVNAGWLNLLAAVIVAVLLALSGTLIATPCSPAVNVTHVAEGLAAALAAGGIIASIGLGLASRRRPAPPVPVFSQTEKLSWRMPPLAPLQPVRWSPGLKRGSIALCGYLIVAVLLLALKAIQLGGG